MIHAAKQNNWTKIDISKVDNFIQIDKKHLKEAGFFKTELVMSDEEADDGHDDLNDRQTATNSSVAKKRKVQKIDSQAEMEKMDEEMNKVFADLGKSDPFVTRRKSRRRFFDPNADQLEELSSSLGLETVKLLKVRRMRRNAKFTEYVVKRQKEDLIKLE